MFVNIDPQARMRWRERRARIESQNKENGTRRSIAGDRTCTSYNVFHAINFLVRLSGLYSRGRRNAQTYGVTTVDLVFPDLPSGFDGYSILSAIAF